MRSIRELVTGLQHIGLPTSDVQKTVDFYKLWGFDILWEKGSEPQERVVFMKCGSCVIETYYAEQPAMKHGAWDHIALDVNDIEQVYAQVRALGFEALDGKITDLPFFANGVRFFIILGPNGEKLEFNQIL